MTLESLRRAGLGLVLAAGLSFGQTPAAAPAFEVASVKPAPPLNPMMIAQGKMHIGMKVDGARVDIGSLSMADLIRIAYKIKAFQITGPDWMTTERFDILAKMPEGATEEQVPGMLQALLADRFKLTIHRENKEQPIYALVVAKGGHKMKDAPPDEPTANADEPPGKGGMMFGSGKDQMRISGDMGGKGMTMQNSQMGKIQMSMGPNGTMHMESSKTSMPALAEMLTRFVDRPIVDMTELKGNFQVALDLSLDEIRNVARAAGMAMPGPMGGGGGGGGASGPIDAASDPSANTIFASVQQLGLKLEARKSPVEKIVVDHLEKAPTEN